MGISKDAELTTVEADDGLTKSQPQAEIFAKDEQIVAPDQFDEKYQTTRNEIWAYYACV